MASCSSEDPDIRILPTRIVTRRDTSACRAYVTVAIPDLGIEVAGIRIIERDDGSLYAQLPNQRDHAGTWFPAVRFTDPTITDAVKAAALSAMGGGYR